jgi:hypothetical protein
MLLYKQLGKAVALLKAPKKKLKKHKDDTV